MKENKEFFKELLEACSPSGYEKAAINVWDNFCSKIDGLEKDYSDHQGNSVWRIGNGGGKKIMFSAHIDEISARVSHIADDGIISIINVGGVDKKVLPGNKVLIMGDSGNVPGIIGKLPIHLEECDERDNALKFNALKVNTGAESKNEVLESSIHIGCPVVLERETIVDFGKHRICSQGLDDKSGIYVLSQLAKMLADHAGNFDDTYYFAALGSEEIGTYGGTIIGQAIKPDIAINLDVTFAQDGDCGVKKEEEGDVWLGKGGVIEFGPDKDYELALNLIEIAKYHEIPYQLASSRAGGTDTCTIRRFSGDVQTMLVSIPSINMHTGIEVVDWRDLDNISWLLYRWVIGRKK